MSTYLDNNATAPLRPAVKQAIVRGLEVFGNPSAPHQAGQAARMIVDGARHDFADYLGIRAEQVVFTSGGTESSVTAIRGLLADHDKSLITSAIEHPASYETAAALKAAGRQVDVVPVTAQGVIDLTVFEKTVADNPGAIVSIMAANNETGVVQPVAEIAALCRKYGATLHVDAVQLFGKGGIQDIVRLADAVTLTFHKVGGPKGIGALILKNELEMQALLTGGKQERNRRAGTETVPMLAGIAPLIAELRDKLPAEVAEMARLRDLLEAGLRDIMPDARIIGAAADRLCNTTCLILPGMSGETAVLQLDLGGVQVSQGSACSSGRSEPSRVLLAHGFSADEALSSLRISLGWHNTEADITALLKTLKTMVKNDKK